MVRHGGTSEFAEDKIFDLVGAGGHMLVVHDALLMLGIRVRVWDHAAEQKGYAVKGIAVSTFDPARLGGSRFHVSIGNNITRRELTETLRALDGTPTTVVHPTASVSNTSRLGTGCFVAANAVVASHASVGEGTILNHTCVVDHECQIGPYVHIAPGVILGGAVKVGQGALVGAGARILPGICIGAHATIGAGAVILRDVPDEAVYVGVPGKRR